MQAAEGEIQQSVECNYLPFFDMSEEISKFPGKNVEGQLDAICADIQARKERRVNLTSELKEQMTHYHKNHAPKVRSAMPACTTALRVRSICHLRQEKLISEMSM